MDTRKHDLETLRGAYKTASSDERRAIAESARKIGRETKAIRDMREVLVKAHRDGNRENIKDIHYYIEKKQRYQNG